MKVTPLHPSNDMSWIQYLQNRWHAFRTWQIGECTVAAGTGDKQLGKAFFRGSIDSALPFFSGETMNTLLQLVFRPGYMIREFLRGKDNHILNPMTALVVFFAMQVVLSSMIVPDGFRLEENVYQTVLEKMNESEFRLEHAWNELFAIQIVQELFQIYRVTHLDLFPADVHTHSQQFLAGLEGWLRAQGVFTFMWQMMLVTCSLWLVGRRRYRLTFSASACIAAYWVCQYCFYNALVLLFSFGRCLTIPFWLALLLLYVNIFQLLGIGHKRALRYLALLVLVMLLLFFLFVLLFAALISFYAYGHML